MYTAGKLQRGKPSKLKLLNDGIVFIFRESSYKLNAIVTDALRNNGSA